MGNGSSNFPASVDAIARIQDGVDYIEETDPNDAYATVEATQGFLGGSGASQAHNTTVLKQIANILPSIRLSYDSTTQLIASAGDVICLNASGSLIKLRSNTTTTAVIPSLSADTQYYVYAVADATATTVTFETGTNATTAPTATTYRKIGKFQTNSSSQIIADSIFNEADLNLNLEKQVIKAWLVMDGTQSDMSQAVKDSFNIQGIVDNGTGDFTINFKTPFSTANYICIGTGINNASSHSLFVSARSSSDVAVGSIRVEFEDHAGALRDPNYGCLIFMGV